MEPRAEEKGTREYFPKQSASGPIRAMHPLWTASIVQLIIFSALCHVRPSLRTFLLFVFIFSLLFTLSFSLSLSHTHTLSLFLSLSFFFVNFPAMQAILFFTLKHTFPWIWSSLPDSLHAD